MVKLETEICQTLKYKFEIDEKIRIHNSKVKLEKMPFRKVKSWN